MSVILYKGDCLVESDKIASGSVDLILTDLPYGNMNTDGGRRLGIKGWDVPIEPSEVYAVANRILRRNGKVVLFSQEPYTTRLINEAIPNIPFSYRMIWEKDTFANHLGAKKAPVSYYEDVLVFSKRSPKHDFEGAHPLRTYFESVREFIPATIKEINKALGNSMSSHYFTKGEQFCIPTEKNYEKLIEAFNIDQMPGFMPFDEIKAIDDDHRARLIEDLNGKYPAVFNLWQGGKYKSNILRYKKDYDGFHPTQKPVLLLEDLIKTFSNEGDTVVDLTMGSGSTGVAAANTGRKFIGIELDADYYEIARKRIDSAMEATI